VRSGTEDPASNQLAIKRWEIEVWGGRTTSPAAISSRVTQRASSSSLPALAIESGAALAMNPSMSDDGNGHGCEEW
jgi:hypothetical protein